MRTNTGNIILIVGSFLIMVLFVATSIILQNYNDMIVFPLLIVSVIFQFILAFLIEKFEDKHLKDDAVHAKVAVEDKE